MGQYDRLRKNPSRETCESIIRRILSAEISERGQNRHFRHSSDFLPYFESLYPSSESLAKQVQRAVKSMDMAKDGDGFYIINKTQEQIRQEEELKHFFQASETVLGSLEGCETVFLRSAKVSLDYLIHLISSTDTLKDKYATMVKASNGVLIYTENKEELLALLKPLLS